MQKIRAFPENHFTQLMSDIGESRYKIFEKTELLPDGVFRSNFHFQDYNCVFASTAATASDYNIVLKTAGGENKISNLFIPKGNPIIVVRLLRYCEHDGIPHYNADDQVIFPTREGLTYRLSRKNAPDHYIALSGIAGLRDIADAYQLPDQKYGMAKDYKAKGAELHVEFHTEKGKRTF